MKLTFFIIKILEFSTQPFSFWAASFYLYLCKYFEEPHWINLVKTYNVYSFSKLEYVRFLIFVLKHFKDYTTTLYQNIKGSRLSVQSFAHLFLANLITSLDKFSSLVLIYCTYIFSRKNLGAMTDEHGKYFFRCYLRRKVHFLDESGTIFQFGRSTAPRIVYLSSWVKENYSLGLFS